MRASFSTIRTALLAGAAASVFAASTARAENVPTVEELYRLFKEQQKVIAERNKIILEQQRRIQALERQAATSEAELARTRRTVRANVEAVNKTRRDIEAAHKDVREARTVMATREDLDRTKTELGTQPSQSVFRIMPTPPGWMAMGEFLYLRPTTDIVAFTFDQSGGPESHTEYGLNHSFDPGFRVGFGYRFGDGTDVKLAYTFLRASSKSTAGNPEGQFGFLVSPALDLFQFTCCDPSITAQGEIKYRLAYDTVDAEFGLNFLVGSHLRMRGVAGLRYVRIDQKLSGSIATQAAVFGFPDAVSSGEVRNDFWGIGPRLALSGMWDLGSGFSIDGRFGGTLAVGSSSLRGSNHFFATGITTSTSTFRGPSSARLVPGVEAAISLAYQMPLGTGMMLKAAVGYEFNHWFNLRGFAGGEGSDSGTTGLSLDGFFAKAAVTW